MHEHEWGGANNIQCLDELQISGFTKYHLTSRESF